MNDLHEIWDKIPETFLQDEDIDTIVTRRSKYQFDLLKRLLWFELGISWVFLMVLFFIYPYLGIILSIVCAGVVVLGTIFGLLALGRINRLELKADVKTYLTKGIRCLRTYIWQFVVSIQLVGTVLFAYKKYTAFSHLSWDEWLLSPDGLQLLFIFAFVEAFLLFYARVFYVSRMLSLKKYLKEFEN